MKRLLGSVLFALVVVSGCAAHRYSVDAPVAKKFGTYHSVEVSSFSSTVDTPAARQVAEELPGVLVQELANAERPSSDQKLFGEVTTSTERTDGVLVIRGTVLSFEEGSRAKRYLIGMGAGKAFATVRCVFADKASGEEIATATFDGELSGGFFGGSSSGAAEGIVKAIREFVADNY